MIGNKCFAEAQRERERELLLHRWQPDSMPSTLVQLAFAHKTNLTCKDEFQFKKS